MASFKATIFFAFVALFALATAIPAPQRPKAALQQIEPRPVAAAASAGGSLDAADELEAGAEDQDLKGASSYGYGYYGGFPSYGYGYYPGYAYSYGWGRYPYYRYGGLYGGYWY
uniref:Putative ggy family antimicrobial peptide n=1 Tax=Anopheles aquasalis TaxID=42839 RepID=T1DER1_ANOAQ